MSSRQYLIDALTRHKTFIQRKGAGTFNQMLPFIKQLEAKTEALLLRLPESITKARQKEILAELNKLHKLVFDNMNKKVVQQAKALAKYEAEFIESLSNKALNDFESVKPTFKQVQAAAFTNILSRKASKQGAFNPDKDLKSQSVQDILSNYGDSVVTRVTQSVRNGIALGQTNEEIAKGFRDNSNMTRRQAKSVAMTLTNLVSNAAQAAFYQENADIITGYQIVATLDDATTLTCAALDGQVFPIDEMQYPPYHWGCRTTFVPVFDPDLTKGSEVTGTRPAQNADGSYSRVSPQTTYNSWLRSQSKDYQDEILGPGRANLFRSGATIQSFVDENYQPINLSQLQSLDKKHT